MVRRPRREGFDIPVTVKDSVDRLDCVARSGELATMCAGFGVEIVTLFGSAADAGAVPGDVDVAIGFTVGAPRDLLGAVDALAELVPGDHLDVMDLDRAGPVAQKAAMSGRVLYEAHPSVTTEREIRAFMAYEDTRWLRDLQTEALRS